MEIVLESLRNEWEMLLRASPRLVAAVVLFLFVVVLGRLAGRGLSLVLSRAHFPQTHRDFFRKLVIWVFVFIGLSLALNVIGLKGAAAGLLTGGGITAVVLGFAFREIGENFLAGFFLAFSRPFRMGDLIQSGDLEGVVKGIELRSTHIRSADGRDIFIPSSHLFKNPLVNFTLDGLRRLGFEIGIDYRDDSEKASSLLLAVVEADPDVLADPAPYAGVRELGGSFVVLSVTFWVDTFKKDRDVRIIRSRLMSACQRSLLSAGYTVSSEVSTNIQMLPTNSPPGDAGRTGG